MNDIAKEKWLRQNKTDIFKYLPAFLKNDERFKFMNDSDSVEHEQVRKYIVDIFKQSFIETATWGLDKWEYLIGIPINHNIDNEARRIKIKLYLNRPISVTVKFLTDLVNNYLEDTSAKIIEHNDEYYFELEFNLDALKSLTDMKAAINLYKPAHLGFLIVFRILSTIKSQHKANIEQYINTMGNFWNLGTAESTYWDGVYLMDGIIDFSGIKPDSKYKDRQTHKVDIVYNIMPIHYIIPNNELVLKMLIDSAYAIKSQHKANIVCNIDLKQQRKIDYTAFHYADVNSKQSQSRGEKNLLDGSFCFDGTHDFSGGYIVDDMLENRVTITDLDKNGNEIKGGLEIV